MRGWGAALTWGGRGSRRGDRVDGVVRNLGGHGVWDVASWLVVTSPGSSYSSAGREGQQGERVLHLSSDSECCVLERQ